ncbi:hypothetical protein HII31_02337 [Pseudocercospora fuligena]|uniref:Rhodopsin domain-containing protein n=1 Tax=Pseudocercospora fuligena TaxID=685502 RepID=A0A8H6VLL8_9PEZI|nr:hypothetical protein HII31_02337 [Pseudocercospora fuligena]
MTLSRLLFGDGGDILLAVTWTWAGIAATLYVLRACYASRELSREHSSVFGIRWDFFWVTLAFTAALTAQVAITVSYCKAANTHQRPSAIVPGLRVLIQTSTISGLAVLPSMIFGRFAVIALLLTLQGQIHRQWKVLLYAIGAIQAIFLTTHMIVMLNQCSPVRKLWDVTVPGTCDLMLFNQKFGYVSGSVGAASDFSLAIYPAIFIIRPLMKLSLPLRIGVCCILGGGVVAGVAGIVKMVSLGAALDLYGHYATYVIWVLTETWFIIIFGTIPTVKPVFKAFGKGINHMCGRPTNRSSSLPRLERIYIPSNPVTLATLEPCSLASTSKSRTVTSEDKGSKSRTVISEDKVVWSEKPRQRQFKPWSMDFDLETNREAYRSRYGPVV